MKWREVILNEICTSQYGYTASAEEQNVGLKFLRITDIVPETINWLSVPYCAIDEEDIKKYKLEKGDIVIARTGNTTGYAKLIRDDVDAVFASYLIRLRVNPLIANPQYIGRLIESKIYKSFVNSIKGGSAQGNANAKMLTLFKFKIPPLPIQQKIADILSKYDDLIENNRRRIELLERSARLLYKEWFVRLRFPGHEHTPIIDGIPEGWEKVRLKDIADLTMGQSPESEYYNEDRSGLPFHQGVTNFGIRFPENKVYCAKITRIANEGDILFSVRAPVGRMNISLEKIIIGRGLAAIRAKHNYQGFLYYHLKNYFFKEDMIGSGVIFASVTKAGLENVQLIKPKDSILAIFLDKTTSIDEQIKILFRQNQKLKQARDILLPKLMNGEIEV
jgi:type I restriction enzyme S subunit